MKQNNHQQATKSNVYCSEIYCQCIDLNCYKALCSAWQAEWEVVPHRNLRWRENNLSVNCHRSEKKNSFWIWLNWSLFRRLYDGGLRPKCFCPLDLLHEKGDFSSWWQKIKDQSHRECCLDISAKNACLYPFTDDTDWLICIWMNMREKNRAYGL